MNDVFFTADNHWGHAAIIQYASRPFASTEEMNEVMVERWNEVVKQGDIVYHLGDFALIGGSKLSFGDATKILARLHGQKFLLLGNHDPERLWGKWIGGGSKWVAVEDVKMVKANGQKIWLSHYAHRVFPSAHHGAWHLYGHCFDEDTEVLTLEGWRGCKEVTASSLIATIAYPTMLVEYQTPLEIIHTEWTGSEYILRGRNVDGVFTANHTMVVSNSAGRLSKIQAESFTALANRILPLCGTSCYDDYPLSDDMLRLYVWLVTDGSIENRTLGRFHLSKDRKISRITTLLLRLNLSFTQNIQASGTTKVNFTVPRILLDFSMKPLDPFIRFLSQRQALVFVEEYCQTDGNHQGKNAFQISTAKPSEADLLQHFLVTHGFSCNLHSRIRDLTSYGYSTYKTWILSANSKRFWKASKSISNMTSAPVANKPFWCIRVPNQTVIIRRNGKVHVTGNSHNTLADDPHSLSMDVGVDTHSFYPYSFEEIAVAMSKKSYRPVDHHSGDD